MQNREVGKNTLEVWTVPWRERRKQGIEEIQPCLPGVGWDRMCDVKMELYKEP